jgi:hypothetical protein
MVKNILMLCLLLPLAAYAQRKVHPLQADNLAFVLGFKGGVSFSNMHLNVRSPQAVDRNRSRKGVSLGIVYHKPLGPQWGVQPELVYASQGYEVHYGDSVWSFREEVRHGYFNLPLLVQYLSPSGLSLYSGPQPGFLVFNRRDNFTTMDLSWVIGGAYLSKIGLGAEVRYNAGLINIALDTYDYLPFVKARNSVVQAGMVYFLAPAKKRPR